MVLLLLGILPFVFQRRLDVCVLIENILHVNLIILVELRLFTMNGALFEVRPSIPLLLWIHKLTIIAYYWL